MKKDDSIKKKKRFFTKKFFSIILLLIVVGIILSIPGAIAWLYATFYYLRGYIRRFTGVDTMLANGVVLLLLIALVLLPIWRIIISFSALPIKQKKIYRILPILLLAAFFFVVYFLPKDLVFFDPDTGEPAKYYTIDSSGGKYEYIFSNTKGYDPRTGNLLQKITKKVAADYFKAKEKAKAKAKQKEKEKHIFNSYHEGKYQSQDEEENDKQDKRKQDKEEELKIGSGHAPSYHEITDKHEQEIMDAETERLRNKLLAEHQKYIEDSIKNADPNKIRGSLKKYKGVVTNITNHSIIIAISEGLCGAMQMPYNLVATVNSFALQPKLSITKIIHPRESVSVSLSEGKHYLALLNQNGDNISPNIMYLSFNDDNNISQNDYVFQHNYILKRNQFSYDDRHLLCCKIFWFDINDYVSSIHEMNMKEYATTKFNGVAFDYYDDYFSFVEWQIKRGSIQGPPVMFNDQPYPIRIAYIILIPLRNDWEIAIQDLEKSVIIYSNLN